MASLCHDIGKVVSVPNHPAIAAEILFPYVRDEVYRVIAAHQDFQGRHYYGHLGMDPDARQPTPASPGTSWPSSSPTTGTRPASTPTTRPDRSSTSSRWCARSSAHPKHF